MPRYTNRQQLLSTQTVADIAKEVHHDETPKLINRQYLFADYDPRTNLWTRFNAGSEVVDWDTTDRLVCVSNIRHVDMATVPNQAVADNPETMRDEQAQALADGPNMIMPLFPMNGRRSSDTVAVYAVSALVRLRAVRINPNIYQDKVTFKFGFYSWTKIDATGHLDNNTNPNIQTLVKWLPQGYSSQLDDLTAGANYQGIPYATRNLDMLMNSEKVKVLTQKEEIVNISSIEGSVNMRVVRLYKEFKDPIILKYDPNDQQGFKHLNQKLYFAIRSDIPNLITADIEPLANVCTKLYYTDVM